MRDILNSNGINVYVNTISAQEPLEVETDDNTSSTMKIKGLNGFGSAGQIIRTSGTSLGYSNICNLQNILTTKTGGGLRFYEYTENDGAGTTNLITLGNATDNIKFINKNFNILLPEQTGTIQLAVSVSSPLEMANDNIILKQSEFQTILTAQTTDFIPIFDADGTTFEKITVANLKTNVNHGTNPPISNNSITSNIELDLGTISTTDISTTDNLLFASNDKTFYKNTVASLKTSLTLPAVLPIYIDNNNEYAFSISQLGSSNGSITSTLITAEGGNDASLRKITFGNLGDTIQPGGINFGTDSTSSTSDRNFGNSTYDTNVNGNILYLKSQGTERVNINQYVLTMSNSASRVRLGSTVDTNALNDVNTTSCLSSAFDLHLISVGQTYADSLNRFCCIAGSSQTETAIFGFAGDNITIANGGIPNPEDSASTKPPRKSVFTMTTGTDSAYSIVNRSTTAFSSTITQFTIKGQDTNFWTENVIVNGSYSGGGTTAKIKLNSTDGVITSLDDRAIVGRDLSTGYIYLGNATDSSSLFSLTTFAKIISLNNHLDSNATNLVIKCNGEARMLIENSGSKRILMGEKADDYGSSAQVAPQCALMVCNRSASSDFQASRIGIQSMISTKDPVLEMYANAGSDSTQLRGFIYWTKDLEWNIGSDTNAGLTNILNNFVFTGGTTSAPRRSYFANMRADLNSGMYLVWGTDISATSGTHGWKLDIGGSGDLHFKYSTNLNSFPNIIGYIATTKTSTGLMNFTGQHRCIPEEEELYNNVENYIGMIVETTGKYNSIDYQITETTEIGVNKTKAHRDPVSNEWIEDYYEETPMTYKNVEMINTNEASVNEAQPIIRLTTTAKSKKVYGVISNKEDGNNREFGVGCFISDLGKRTDNRLFINSVGEGGILVNSEGGNIENGDLLCSSSTTGIAMKQTEEYVANYTIGKSTQDYNFTGNENKLIGCVYYCG